VRWPTERLDAEGLAAQAVRRGDRRADHQFGGGAVRGRADEDPSEPPARAESNGASPGQAKSISPASKAACDIAAERVCVMVTSSPYWRSKSRSVEARASFGTVFRDRGDPVLRRYVGDPAWGTFVGFTSEPMDLLILLDGGTLEPRRVLDELILCDTLPEH
jgi:hypothetical protein